MKNIVFLFLLVLLCSCSSSQTVYKDHTNQEISDIDFRSMLRTAKYLEIPSEDPNTRKLISRALEGSVKTRRPIDSLIELSTRRDIDPKKPLVVIYWPGSDRCNATALEERKPLIFQEMKRGIIGITGEAPLFLYSQPSGLSEFSENIDWQKDPGGLFEKIFFKHHYPCWSFVVISPSGEFAGILGEFKQATLFGITRHFSEKADQGIENESN